MGSLTVYVGNIYADRTDPDCRPRYVRVVLHPDLDTLRAAAARYARRRGKARESYTNAAGVFQPLAFTSRYDRKLRRWVDTTPPMAGVIRLAEGYVTDEIVTHEATHACAHIARLHAWSKPGQEASCDLGGHCDQTEEAFAYMLGSVAAELLHMLQHHRTPQMKG